jgi:SapC.
MSRIELLDNLSHKDLRVNPLFSKELGDNIASTITFVTEFAEVQKEYPILFRKDLDKDLYQAVVLFGIQKDENLFLGDSSNGYQKFKGWSAGYVPAVIRRGPFSIGLRKKQEQSSEDVEPLVHVDMEHPKVSTDVGVRVFLEQGGNSQYLQQVIETLNLIRDGISLNAAMFDAFVRHELMEDVDINIELKNEEKLRLSGFKTINADRLNQLSGESLAELSRSGFLQAAYFVAASLSNIQKLIDIKNHRLQSN